MKVSSNEIVLEEMLTLDRPTPDIVLSSLGGTFGDINDLQMGLVDRPARHRSRPVQHDPFPVSGIVYDLKFLPTPSSEIHQFSIARFERMRSLSRSWKPIELSRLYGLFSGFCGWVVEDDSGVGSGFDYVEPFVFGAVPVWDG